MKEDSKFRQFLSTKYFSLIVVIILMTAVFYFIVPNGALFGIKNIRAIFNGMVTTSFFAVGSGMLILFGYLDLSAGAVGAFSGAIMTLLNVQFGVPIWLAIIAGIVGACLCGWLNAFMVNKLHFEAFIATMAMMSLAHGVSYNLVSGQGTVVTNDFLTWLGGTKIFGNLVPITLIIAIVMFVIYGVILAKTKFGRTVYLCGGNKQAARLSGLKPKRLSYFLFINGAFLVGVCGVLVTARTGAAYATALDTYQFTGMTAAMLGGIAFGGGSGDMLGCFLGMLILAIFNDATTLLGLDHNIATIFQGLLLVIALAIDAVSARRQAKNWVKKSLLENN